MNPGNNSNIHPSSLVTPHREGYRGNKNFNKQLI